MPAKGFKKQFCIHGHDTFVCGRHPQSYQCLACRDERETFCPIGHKYVDVGQYSNGHCRACTNLPRSKFCRVGHDKSIVGVNSEDKCKECIKLRKQIYFQINKEKINLYHRNKAKIDLLFNLKRLLRSRLTKTLRRNQKAGSAVKDLGCTIEYFKQYIESKFYNDMTWSNWGKVWELDHIIPLFKFDLTNREEILKACNYTNLQPLTIVDHRKKTSKEAHEWKKRTAK